MKHTPIEAFKSDLSDVSILDDTSFFELYPWHFNQFTIDLKNEILTSLLKLSNSHFRIYLEEIKSEIKNTFIYDPSTSIIDYWIKKFDLKEIDFPFLLNENVTLLTSAFYKKPYKKTEETKLARKIQLEFYWYASFLEANKMLTFIDKLLLEKNDSISNKKAAKYFFKIKTIGSRTAKAKSLFDDLEKHKYVDITSKNDFINAFTGFEPKNKINWIGNFGDLKTLIIHCFQSEFLEKTPNEWVITSNIFVSKGINFNNRKISGTKETLSKDKIIKLINRALN